MECRQVKFRYELIIQVPTLALQRITKYLFILFLTNSNLAISSNVFLTIKLVNVPFGGQCKLNTQCQGSKHAVVCELGRCVCRPGYVSTNLECHKGKLKMLFNEYGT